MLRNRALAIRNQVGIAVHRLNMASDNSTADTLCRHLMDDIHHITGPFISSIQYDVETYIISLVFEGTSVSMTIDAEFDPDCKVKLYKAIMRGWLGESIL